MKLLQSKSQNTSNGQEQGYSFGTCSHIKDVYILSCVKKCIMA